MSTQPPVINIFEKAARKAGKVLIRDFGEIENLQIKSKGVGDFVTNTDLKVEEIILNTLKKYYPNSTYISEESDIIKGDEETIVIDPIDGTINFIHGIPYVGIVIARIVEKEIIDGIIFNPITNEFYWSSKGKGSWCNNKRLRVSKRQKLSDCIISSNTTQLENNKKEYQKEINNISKNCSGLRRLGATSIDLAYVASGKLDACFEKKINLWDVCSGVLLVKEAGGKISQINGADWETESKEILASNLLIHEEICEKLI